MLKVIKTGLLQGSSYVVRRSIQLAYKVHPHLRLSLERLANPKGIQGEPFTYLRDGLATIHNSDCLKEERFLRAYQLGKETGSWKGWDLQWRAYVILWCAEWASRLPGDFVECGVNRGGFSRAILDYIPPEHMRRDFYLFDTFRGLDSDYLTDEEKTSVANIYHYDECYESVKQTFAPFPFVKLIQGSVPDTLSSIDIERVSFLSIDMNCVVPEIAAAKFFWPRMVPGGVIVLDDYGFSAHGEQKDAFDALLKDWGVSVLSLPTGQGLIFKPIVSAR